MSWLRLMEEHLKRSEHSPKKKTASAVHKKQNPVITLVVEMWPAYLIEIFVIIVGIWITFSVEQWRDNGKERQLEKIYRKNLLVDISTDQHSLKYAVDNSRILLASGNELLYFAKQPSKKDITPVKINLDLQNILSRPKFITSDATFSDLKNSGNLHLLDDVHLKNLLFSYYSMTQDIKDAQDAEQQATIVISGPYFFKHFAFGDISNQDNNHKQMLLLANDPELNNNLLLRIRNRDELLNGYQKAILLATQLQRLLKEPAN